MKIFSIGDKVICVNIIGLRWGLDITLYNIYEVVNIYEDNEVAVYNDRGKLKYYRPHRFELLSEYRVNIINEILDGV